MLVFMLWPFTGVDFRKSSCDEDESNSEKSFTNLFSSQNWLRSAQRHASGAAEIGSVADAIRHRLQAIVYALHGRELMG